jgi:hypothetical protein
MNVSRRYPSSSDGNSRSLPLTGEYKANFCYTLRDLTQGVGVRLMAILFVQAESENRFCGRLSYSLGGTDRAED